MSKKPGVVDERIEAREYLPVGMMFDHDVVDGADAARFLGRLGEPLKKAYGLEKTEKP
jgi:pyruvate/2-oxoglutarate dehydrogenase complex dihydrolipoamide acyltransferase (E2) component